MSLFFEVHNQTITISGKTFPHKEAIKALGARFEGSTKTWVIDNSLDKLPAIEDLCQKVGGGPRSSQNTELFKPMMVESAQETPADTWTVAQLMGRAQQAISQAFPQAIWLTGEIQNLNRRGQHIYLNIADAKEGASESATMTANAALWASAYRSIIKTHGQDKVEATLAEGLQVRFYCQVRFYKDRGTVTLSILDFDPDFTQGALLLARQKLLKEMRQKGLDQLNKALLYSRFPLKVGLISARDSRAQSDFLDQLASYKFPGQVLFYHAAMQGEQVVSQVVAGLKALDQKNIDVIVITRGGGSAADLRWFDNRDMALAIAHCKTPVIAAIGHHDDTCVAEEVCYRREKTPTAAADFLLHTVLSTKTSLQDYQQRLWQGLKNRHHQLHSQWQSLPSRLSRTALLYLSEHNTQLTRYSAALTSRSQQTLNQQQHKLQKLRGQISSTLTEQGFRCTHQINQLRHNLIQHYKRSHSHHLAQLQLNEQKLQQAWQQALSQRQHSVAQMYHQLKAYDPSPWLSKGWTQLFMNGKPLRSVLEASPGSSAKARLLDGTLTLTVNKITPSPQTQEKV